MDEYMLYASTAETVGIPFEWMTPAEIKDRWPLVRTEDLKGAIYHPTDGYINPADVTMAMAKGARQRGVDRAEMAGRRLRLDRRSLGRHLHEDGGKGRQPRPLRRAGRDPCRACGHRHRQPRAAHGAAAGDQDARHPGGASVHRDRARPGAGRMAQVEPRAPRAARCRRQVVRARGTRRLDPRAL
jgi:hypothetical protein